MKIFELMSRAFDTARPDESVEAAESHMRRAHLDHLVVIDGEEVVGYVSRRTLRRRARSPKAATTRVGAVMNKAVITVNPETDVLRVAKQLRGRDFGCITAVGRGRVWGIVTLAGLLETAGGDVEADVTPPSAPRYLPAAP